MKVLKTIAITLAMLFAVSACTTQADVVSQNISKSADNFDVLRRIIFYNGITDTYILSVEGFCSVGNDSTAIEMSVTCKVGPNLYKKHILGRSDNVTFFAEQLDAANVSPDHYIVVFKPSVIVPDVQVK